MTAGTRRLRSALEFPNLPSPPPKDLNRRAVKTHRIRNQASEASRVLDNLTCFCQPKNRPQRSSKQMWELRILKMVKRNAFVKKLSYQSPSRNTFVSIITKKIASKRRLMVSRCFRAKTFWKARRRSLHLTSVAQSYRKSHSTLSVRDKKIDLGIIQSADFSSAVFVVQRAPKTKSQIVTCLLF